MIAWQRRVILLGSWLLTIAYAFPGKLTTDSIQQLATARGQERLGDSHPPLMATLWHYVDLVVNGPFGMLVLQTGAFLFGLDALFRRVLGPRAAAGLAGAVLLFPPILAPMAVIWKDSQMAGYLVAGIALLLSERRWHRIAGCALLGVATAFRYNAVAATLPIVMLLFQWSWHGWRRYGLAACVWLAITFVAFAANRAFTEYEEHMWHSSLAVYDVVGTIRYTPDYSDAEIKEDLEGTPLVVQKNIRKHCRKYYSPRFHFGLLHGNDRVFDVPKTEDQRDALEEAWWEVISSNPAGYLRHRLRIFRELLGDTDAGLIAPYVPGHVEVPWHAGVIKGPTQLSRMQRAANTALGWLSTTWLFLPRFYFWLALALLPLCRSRLSFTLLASGLMYELTLFLIAPSADFRYSHWMIACTVIAIPFLIASRIRPRRRAVPV